MSSFYLPLALGRSPAAPPEVPADRLEVLRSGASKTMHDPDFPGDTKGLEIDVEPMNAADTKAMVERLLATPPAVVTRIEDALLQ